MTTIFKSCLLPSKNGLYEIQTFKTSLTAIFTHISITIYIKSWYRRLDYLSYANLKCFGNAKRIDKGKIKVDKDVLPFTICIKIIEKCYLSYKIDQSTKNMFEKLHFDLIRPIISIRWNRNKYSLFITDGYSRYKWVKNMYEK